MNMKAISENISEYVGKNKNSQETILMVPSSSLGERRFSPGSSPLDKVFTSPPIPHAISKPFGEYLTQRIQPDEQDEQDKQGGQNEQDE